LQQLKEKQVILELGEVSISNCTQRTIAIVGGKGSGKTQTLKMLAYSAPDDLPCYIFDPLDIIRIEGFDRVIVTKALAIDAENKGSDLGSKYGQLFNSVKEKKVIFAFRDMLQAEIVFFCNAFFATWRPENALIFFDEVHDFTPERGMGQEYSEEIERAVRHWRNKNCGFILTTQRPAFTSKKVLGLIDFMIMYRITYTNDVEAVKDLIKNMLSKEQSDSVIQKLQTKSFLEGFTLDFIP
jgi:ABC-type dipeptide/oligopeptide/nickel transport system ATPase component